MRHRFHSICPYFAMFPESFVEKHLVATKFRGVVFDPFCGRGTTIFESLIQNRSAAGCDVNPVAFCISAAKSDPPTLGQVLNRLRELEDASSPFRADFDEGSKTEFFKLCFDPETYTQIRFLKNKLSWHKSRTDRFIAALCLGSLHGESHRSPNYFSNRMPRTISTKPAYSVRWWRKYGYHPPHRDIFNILRHVTRFRFASSPPTGRGEVKISDARRAASVFPHLFGRVTDVITSPPYLDTTNYFEDQWLRLWFLAGKAVVNHSGHDSRHYNARKYWDFLTEAWEGVAPLLAERSRIVVRIGGRKQCPEKIKQELSDSLSHGIKRPLRLIDAGVSSKAVRTQSDAFRGSRGLPTTEYDFSFLLG